jgi:hypothetical protein
MQTIMGAANIHCFMVDLARTDHLMMLLVEWQWTTCCQQQHPLNCHNNAHAAVESLGLWPWIHGGKKLIDQYLFKYRELNQLISVRIFLFLLFVKF